MKKRHLVSIWYDTYIGKPNFIGLVEEVIGVNGKPVVYPCSIFKQVFGFDLPNHSRFIVA